MKKKIAILIPVLMLSGCRKSQGVVIEKDYFPKCKVIEIRPLNESDCTYPLKATEQQSEEFNLVIEDKKDVYRINVDRNTYNNYEVGDKFYGSNNR